MLVEGWGGEQLPLSVPLALGRRPAPQWLNALEGAISYSVAVNLTDTLTGLPDALLGMADGGSTTGVCSECTVHPAIVISLTPSSFWGFMGA